MTACKCRRILHLPPCSLGLKNLEGLSTLTQVRVAGSRRASPDWGTTAGAGRRPPASSRTQGCEAGPLPALPLAAAHAAGHQRQQPHGQRADGTHAAHAPAAPRPGGWVRQRAAAAWGRLWGPGACRRLAARLPLLAHVAAWQWGCPGAGAAVMPCMPLPPLPRRRCGGRLGAVLQRAASCGAAFLRPGPAAGWGRPAPGLIAHASRLGASEPAQRRPCPPHISCRQPLPAQAARAPDGAVKPTPPRARGKPTGGRAGVPRESFQYAGRPPPPLGDRRAQQTG